MGGDAFVATKIWDDWPNNSAVYVDGWLVESKGTVNSVTLIDGINGITKSSRQDSVKQY